MNPFTNNVRTWIITRVFVDWNPIATYSVNSTAASLARTGVGFEVLGSAILTLSSLEMPDQWLTVYRKCRGVDEHGERAQLTAFGLSSFADGKGYSKSQC